MLYSCRQNHNFSNALIGISMTSVKHSLTLRRGTPTSILLRQNPYPRLRTSLERQTPLTAVFSRHHCLPAPTPTTENGLKTKIDMNMTTHGAAMTLNTTKWKRSQNIVRLKHSLMYRSTMPRPRPLRASLMGLMPLGISTCPEV